MTIIVPSWTDNITLINAQALADTAIVRATWDIRGKMGGRIFARMSHNSNQSLTYSPVFMVRALWNGGGGGGAHPGALAYRGGDIGASALTSGTGSAGSPTLAVPDATGFSAGDIICIQPPGYTDFSTIEWHRISMVGASTLNLDRPLGFSHGGDTVTNHADAFSPIWLPTGFYELIFDNGVSGRAITVQALAQSYDSDQVS